MSNMLRPANRALALKVPCRSSYGVYCLTSSFIGDQYQKSRLEDFLSNEELILKTYFGNRLAPPKAQRGITRRAHRHVSRSFLIISSVISSCPSENFSLNYQIIADYDLTNWPPIVSRKGNYMGINLWYAIDYCCRDNYMHELIEVFPPGDNNQHICTAEQPAVEDGDGETDGSRGAWGGGGGLQYVKVSFEAHSESQMMRRGSPERPHANLTRHQRQPLSQQTHNIARKFATLLEIRRNNRLN